MMWQLKTKALSTLAVVVLRLKQDFRPHPRASSPTLHAPQPNENLRLTFDVRAPNLSFAQQLKSEVEEHACAREHLH